MKRLVLLLLLVMNGCFGVVSGPEAVRRGIIHSGVVQVSHGNIYGSGFVVAREDGYYIVATASHLTRGTTTILVNGVPGKVLVTSLHHDAALVWVRNVGQSYSPFELADAVRGEACAVVGYVPIHGEAVYMLYRGNVTATDYENQVSFNGGAHPGMSGGPLLNERGRAVGVLSRSGLVFGLPSSSLTLFAPARVVREMLDAR